MYIWKQLLTGGEKGFESSHGGMEPLYVPPLDASTPKKWMDTRVETDVLNTSLGNFQTKWFFSQKDHKLLGMEQVTKEYTDPCEVYFSDYRAVGGRLLPHRMQVYHSDIHYGTFTVTNWKLGAN
jgi:hypothetical protein